MSELVRKQKAKGILLSLVRIDSDADSLSLCHGQGAVTPRFVLTSVRCIEAHVSQRFA